MDLEQQGGAPPTATLGTILVVEDDPRMQRVLRRSFEVEHYGVLIAGRRQHGA